MADLKTYRAKRRFNVTTEPEGAASPAAREEGPVFVVQKHAARRLHYDFRLEIDGVLKSWAVPEGPCLDSKVRRLAVQTEDHPLEYGRFEGRIPAGEYGAGVVIVWDRGPWVTLADDPLEALKGGELKMRLAGEKLRGGWTLVRLNKDPKNWLLIKERDDEVRRLEDYDVLAAEPRSVLSGLTVEDLKRAAAPADKPRPARPKPERIAGAKKAPMPKAVSPQLASAADAPPAGEGWLHELKYDGYRTIVRIENGEARLFTRNKHDWTQRYRALAEAFRALDCTSALIDGEVTVQNPRGVTSIDLLETALSEGRDGDLTFFAFDLPYLDGYDLSGAKLIDRKTALEGLLAPHINARSLIQLSEHFTGDGAELFAHACRMGLEGVISKRADAPYVQGRTKTWLKIKRAYVGEFVVVGYTLTTPKRIAAFLIAEEGGDGELVFVGRVTCPSEAISDLWLPKLAARKVAQGMPMKAPVPKPIWTEPAATARVAFNSRAPDGAPRQPVLLGLTPYRKPMRSSKPRLVADRDLAAIRLTNPDRKMFGTKDVTKLDIAVYYARVGDWMLPDLLRRPLSLIRCPSGEREDCFYQRHAFAGLPPGVETIPLAVEKGREDYIYVETAAGFLGLTQFGAIEFHPWGCRIDDPDHPDRFVVDLDPDPALDWGHVCAAAEQLRDTLKQLGFEPFIRTTGGKGLHLVMALAPGKVDWANLRSFAQAFAASAAHDAPNVFTANPKMESRKGRIYVDYLRNVRGSSAIASYSLRANERFTVATPIAWEELRTLEGPRAFDRKSVPQRLSRLAKDPWDGLDSSASDISRKARQSVGLKT
ncbi:MAG: DNA ligase D [Hydrogenophilaceae bacterium]|jgi:bifunctional non-homologous end joining protein LigD|nr:DNA ligase D [Hydrogenophilaceae bacterium]